jgi:hypothetical protein
MAYKLTNVDKWSDLWFSNLSPHAKLLFMFLYENCDNAGFYEINEKFLVFYLGIDRKELADAIKQIQKSYIKSEDQTRLWLRRYLKHQKLLPLNPKNNAHKQVVFLLEENVSDPKKFKNCKEMKNLIPVDPNKVKTQTVVPRGKKFVKPTVEELEAFMKEKEFPPAESEAKRFWNWFESNGWKVGKNPMKVWKGAVNTWIDNWYERNKIARKATKLDNIKEAHEDLSEVDWNKVYSEETVN